MKRLFIPLLLYLGVFLVLFLQFPVNGSLPGKVDTWFFLTAFNDINLFLEAVINGSEHTGNSLYPESNVFSFGNYSFGQALFFLPFKWMGCTDIWAYYLFFSLLFSWNSWSVFKIAEYFGLQRVYAFVAGLLFSCSNYVFGNMDNPDAIFLSIGFFGFYFFLQQLKRQKFGYTLLAYGLIGTEVYFSSYGFLFACIASFLAGIVHYKILLSYVQIKRNAIGIALLLLILTPYLWIYMFGDALVNAYNPAADISALQSIGLKWNDFFHPLKYNLIYPSVELQNYNWLYKSKSVFLGVFFPLCGLYGLFSFKGTNRKLLLTILLLFFLLAIGPFMPFNNNGDPSPLYWIYKKFYLHQYFRINIRAFLMCVLMLSIGASYTLQYIALRRKSILVSAGIFFLILVENVPYKFEKYDSKNLMETSILEPAFNKEDVVLHLPSTFFSGTFPGFELVCEGAQDNYEFEIIREYLYMYGRTKHGGSSVNGFSGFIPQSRMHNQELILEIMHPGILEELVDLNNISHIVVHKDFFTGCNQDEIISFLHDTPFLILVHQTDNHLLFKTTSSNK